MIEGCWNQIFFRFEFGRRLHSWGKKSFTMDPIQIQMIRKLATTKSLPYRTLIRHWLSEKIKSELSAS